jgi:hypothetical protein
MRLSHVIILISGFAVASCGSVRESRLNPVNWFGSSTSTEVETIVTEDGQVVEANPLIGARRQSQVINVNNRTSAGVGKISFGAEEGPYEGTLVDQVTELDVKRTSTGAIVTVAGLTTRQGAYDVRLVPANGGQVVDGVLTLELRALQPIQTAQGPERTRRIRAAAPLSVQELEQIRTVRVIARRNTRTSRR